MNASKLYLPDSGLLHYLLNLQNVEDLPGHPKVEASREGFGIQTVVASLGVGPEETVFWAAHFLRRAIENRAPERLDAIHAGADTLPMASRIRAVALADVWKRIERFPEP